MADDELLQEFGTVLALPRDERAGRLRNLRRRALRRPSTRGVGSMCLHVLAELELDLDQRARLQRRAAREYPRSFTLRALGLTEAVLGRLAQAERAYERATRLAKSRAEKESLSEMLSTIRAARRGNADALSELCSLRAQTESDLAVLRARTSPHDAQARLDRLIREARRRDDDTLVALLTAGKIAVAVETHDSVLEVQLARQLAAESPSLLSFELLGAAERRARHVQASIDAYERAAAFAATSGDREAQLRLSRILGALRSQRDDEERS